MASRNGVLDEVVDGEAIGSFVRATSLNNLFLLDILLEYSLWISQLWVSFKLGKSFLEYVFLDIYFWVYLQGDASLEP